MAPKWGKSVDHDPNVISSKGGQDTSTCQILGHSSHAFWKSTYRDQNLICSEGGQNTPTCQIWGHSPLCSQENARKSQICLIHTVEMSPKWGKSTDDDQNLKSVLKMFRIHQYVESWRRHQMETYSALLALCVGDSLVTGEFPSQRPVTLSFDVFFDLRPNKRFSKQSWGWWFETPSRSLWHYCNDPAIQRDCNKM